MKTAFMLEKLAKDRGIKVPEVGKDVLAYVKRKGTGRLDDRDYRVWERHLLSVGQTAEQIGRRQKSVFLHMETWSLPEMIDIKPERGGIYVHSSTEAFNEEGETEEETVKRWIEHFGLSYHQIHASGHAPLDGVRKLVSGVGAKTVVPIHTEHPELFKKFGGHRVLIPSRASPISLKN